MAKKIEQIIDLNINKTEHGEDYKAMLHIETDKGFRKDLRCEARVYWHGNRCRQHAFGLGGGGDFSKTIKSRPGIATQKALNTLHGEVFTPDAVTAITAEAKHWYESGANKF